MESNEDFRLSRTYANKLWRLTNLYKIKTKDARLVRWRPNFLQRVMLRQLRADCDADWNPVRPIRDIIIKYRQGGVSTFWLLWWLDEVIWNPNTTVAIVAHKQEAIGYLFEIIRLAHESMPDEVRPRVGSDSVRELSFPDLKSKIMVSLEIRSTAVTALHISEWCFIDDAKVRASKGAVPPFGHISGESTGNGIGGDGYETFVDARDGEGRFRRLFVPWYIQREYRLPIDEGTPQLKRTPDELKLTERARIEWGFELTDEQILFRRDKRRELKGLFGQEFPETEDDAFLASGSPFFDNFKIKALLDEEIKHGAPAVETEPEWTMWERPIKGHQYVVGADPADEGADYAVLKVMDVRTMREVFRWRARTSATRFAEVCDRWGRHYFNALLGVEDNNMGLAVLVKLDELLHYPNLYRRDREPVRTRIIKGGVADRPSEGKAKGKLGWHTDMKTKPLMLSQLKAALEGDSEDSVEEFEPDFAVRDKQLLQEAMTFSDEDGKLEGQEGAHDDVVMASAICWQMALLSQRGRGSEGTTGRIFIGQTRQSVASAQNGRERDEDGEKDRRW